MINCELWHYFPHISPASFVRESLELAIKERCRLWLPTAKENLLAALNSLLPIHKSCSMNYIALIESLNVAYFSVVFGVIEQPIVDEGQKIVTNLLRELDGHDSKSLEKFTEITMKLFCCFKELSQTASEFKVDAARFSQFEKWFIPVTIYWTYAWRAISRRCTLRALVEDMVGNSDDMVLPSAVNFLAVHKDLFEDYTQLQINSSEASLICVLKIISIFADNLVLYSNQILQAERSREEAKLSNRGSGVKHNRVMSAINSAEISRAANSIEHIRYFAEHNIRRLLNVNQLLERLSSEDAEKTAGFIQHCLSAAYKQCDICSFAIVEMFCQSHYDQIIKECLEAVCAAKRTNRKLHGDHWLQPLRVTSVGLSSFLLPRLAQHGRKRLVHIIETSLNSNFPKGQPPSYYRRIQEDCSQIHSVLLGNSFEPHLLPELNGKIYINSLLTEDLILQYYAQLADNIDVIRSTKHNFPFIKMKIGAARLTNRTVSIRIHIIGAYKVPTIGRNEVPSTTPSVFIHLELLPLHSFSPPEYFPKITPFHLRESTIIWNKAFEITLPEEKFFANGSVLCFNLVDKTHSSYYDLIGQTYLRLARISFVQCLSLRSLPRSITLPLTLPTAMQLKGVFEVLTDRSANDKLACELCSTERYVHNYHMLPLSQSHVKNSVKLREKVVGSVVHQLIRTVRGFRAIQLVFNNRKR